MTWLIALMLLTAPPSKDAPTEVLQSVKMYYHDTVTVKGKDTYRELTRVGEDPFSKPESIDVVLTFTYTPKSSSDEIEILIEELYEPIGPVPDDGLNRATWVPNVVVYHGRSKFIKNGKIEVKNVPYRTAYFLSSQIYSKKGFRVVAIYFDRNTSRFERIENEIMFDV